MPTKDEQVASSANTATNDDLIAEARHRKAAIDGGEDEDWVRLVDLASKLADALNAAERKVEQYELVTSALEQVRQPGGYAPSGFSAQWRSRAETSEAELARLRSEIARFRQEMVDSVTVRS